MPSVTFNYTTEQREQLRLLRQRYGSWSAVVEAARRNERGRRAMKRRAELEAALFPPPKQKRWWHYLLCKHDAPRKAP